MISKRLLRFLDLATIRRVLKVKTPEEFDALVQRIEASASRHPGHYRFRLALLAILGYAYIVGIFLLLYGLLWGLRQFADFMQDPYLIARLNWITFLLGLGLFAAILDSLASAQRCFAQSSAGASVICSDR